MSIWALADLHLAFSDPSKSMTAFGEGWSDYTNRIKKNWESVVKPDDLILIPGDISWAIKFEAALIDLNWINQLPGTKVILKGNHDYWWPSNKKLSEGLPQSIHFIHNTTMVWNGVAIGGTRLWETDEFSFEPYTIYLENPNQTNKSAEEIEKQKLQDKKTFEKELARLRENLSKLDPNAKTRIAMLHYPPIGADLKDSRVSKILEEFKINIAVFGHLHSLKKGVPMFGEKNGVRYAFASSDYLSFEPLLLV